MTGRGVENDEKGIPPTPKLSASILISCISPLLIYQQTTLTFDIAHDLRYGIFGWDF
jgi:hypothetical protein